MYHRNSNFGPPERNHLDREDRVRLIHLARCLDRRTRTPRKHGGVLKRTGIAVFDALLFTFLNMKTGECYPSHEALAAAADCCIETVRTALRALERIGLIRTVRRIVRARRNGLVGTFQTSNSYVFLLRPRNGPQADAKIWHGTNSFKIQEVIPRLPELSPDLAAALAGLDACIRERERRCTTNSGSATTKQLSF